jgi:hypothetical protein
MRLFIAIRLFIYKMKSLIYPENLAFYEFLLCVSRKKINVNDLMRYIFTYYATRRFIIQISVNDNKNYFLLIKEHTLLSSIIRSVKNSWDKTKKYSNECITFEHPPHRTYKCIKTFSDLDITNINKDGKILSLYEQNIYSAIRCSSFYGTTCSRIDQSVMVIEEIDGRVVMSFQDKWLIDKKERKEEKEEKEKDWHPIMISNI